ncbi:hypothetical protein [Roseomonas indoligenes]|nr:hypothetical protein [Pararoseomonas indoligenes]
MQTALHTFRGPNLTFALVALALVVLFLVVEHVFEWPFPLHRKRN